MHDECVAVHRAGWSARLARASALASVSRFASTIIYNIVRIKYRSDFALALLPWPVWVASGAGQDAWAPFGKPGPFGATGHLARFGMRTCFLTEGGGLPVVCVGDIGRPMEESGPVWFCRLGRRLVVSSFRRFVFGFVSVSVSRPALSFIVVFVSVPSLTSSSSSCSPSSHPLPLLRPRPRPRLP